MNNPFASTEGVHDKPVPMNAGRRPTPGRTLPMTNMQRILIVLLAMTTTAGSWMAFRYHGQLAERDGRIATLTAERDTALAAEKTALAMTDPLRENVDRLTRERDRLQAQTRPQRGPDGGPDAAPPNAGPEDPRRPNMGAFIAMMNSPEGQKMFRTQSAARVRTQYAAFAKKMNLSPQDTTVLMGLLADRQTAIVTARATGGSAEETAARLKAVESEFGDKLLATLGQAGYDQFSEYEGSVPERTAVNQFADEFNSAGTPLAEAQKEGLIDLMQTERENSPANPFDPSKNDPGTVLSLLKDDATFAAWEKQQQDYQSRVLQNAAKTLSPDQVNTLKRVLEQRTERDKAALQTFKSTGTPPPGPPPQ